MPEAADLRGPWWQSILVLGGGTYNPLGYTVTIPKNLKAGNYLLRTELIMMASRPPQIYPECAQLTVTGDGTATPGDEYLVSFPGAYADSGKTIILSSYEVWLLTCSTDPGLIMSEWYMTGGGTYDGTIPPEWNTTVSDVYHES
jgi:hypothetical protein